MVDKILMLTYQVIRSTLTHNQGTDNIAWSYYNIESVVC
jgi:hypothetical protein